MKNKIVIGALSGVIVIALVLVVIFNIGSPMPAEDPTNTESGENSSVTINIPDDSIKDTESEPETEESENGLIIDVSGDPQGTGGSGVGDKPAEKPDKPVEPQKPAEPESKNEGGINIGGGNNEQKYSCGTANHKCATPEIHALISNHEIEGCKLCGSHSCSSFYGTDQWGNGGYFPERCPKYSILKDPLYYCQDCEKKTGDGKNGTFARFILAANCPNCGEYVPARTCHTCK